MGSSYKKGELEGALERVWSGEQALTSVLREDERGKPKLIAQGDEDNAEHPLTP